MADQNKPPERRSTRTDPSALRREVEAARKRGQQGEAAPQSAASLAVRFGGEFGAAILVGAALGYGVDVWLKTAPWGLIVGLALGFVAGAVNVVRAAWAYGASQPLGDPAPRSDEKED